MSPNLRGALLSLAAFGIYATHDVVVKFLGSDYSAVQIIFFSGLLSFPLVTFMLLGDRRDEKGLDRMARDWPTPMANDGCKPSAGNRRTADLTHAAGMWMTPTARDHKDGATTLANTPVNGLLGRQVLVTPMAGPTTCDARRTLNPLFVEALMGWPTGWTGFASVATAWSPWLRRMRCELSRLNCWPMDEVAA